MIMRRVAVLVLMIIEFSVWMFAAKNEDISILFIGTSQTYGMGAADENDTFVEILNRRLKTKTGAAARVVCRNAGIKGSNSSELLEFYRNHWARTVPDVVLINLSVNDNDGGDIFYANIKEFVKINKIKKIKTILILEPTSFEQHQILRYSKNHEALLRAGEEEGVICVDLHKFMTVNKDSGIIWWDFVHLTSFGHKLAADCLYPYIVEAIKGRISEQ